MAYTYANNPVVGTSATAAEKRDAVRFLTQDNQANASSAYKSTDEEIAFLIATEANEFMAAGRLCQILANRPGPVSSKTVGDLTISFGSREDYLQLAQMLFARGMTYQVPTFGGVSRSDKETLTDDTDWLKPLFARKMQQNPSASTETEPVNDYGVQ